MPLESIFPYSVSIELDPVTLVQTRLWKISRLCCKLWNAALDSVLHPSGQAVTRQELLDSLLIQHPELASPARSVLEWVLISLEQVVEQYHQAEKDVADGLRNFMPSPPTQHDEEYFFPLHFSAEFVQVHAPNSLELADESKWFTLTMPTGDQYHHVDEVLITYHADRKRFELEMNPVLAEKSS